MECDDIHRVSGGYASSNLRDTIARAPNSLMKQAIEKQCHGCVEKGVREHHFKTAGQPDWERRRQRLKKDEALLSPLARPREMGRG